MSLILSAPFKADLAPDDKRFIAHCKWLLSQNCGLRPTLPRRRPIKVERDNAGGVVERVRDDRDPQIATGGEKDEPHRETDRSGEQHAERVLVGVRQSEQCRLNHTRDAPSQFAPTEKHGQPLKMKKTHFTSVETMMSTRKSLENAIAFVAASSAK